jgi:hypothetical protein
MTTEAEPSTDDGEDDARLAEASPTRRGRLERPQRDGAPRPSAERDAVAREAADRALQQILLGAGAPGSGVRDLLQDGRDTASQDELMASVEGVTVAEAEGATRPGERGGAPACPSCERSRSLRDLRARPGTGARAVAEGEAVEERTVVVTVTPGTLDPVDPAEPFDPRELYRALRARMPAIQRCYEHELTRGGGSLGGRMLVSLRVMPAGVVANVRVIENATGSEALAACTLRNVGTVRLRVGPEEPAEVRYPIVFARRD